MSNETAPRGYRLIARAAIAVLALVVVAGCSSDDKKTDASSKTSPAVESSTSSSSQTSPSTPSAAPCTLDAATAALSSVSATAATIVCRDGWAAGAAANPDYDLAYLLRDVDGTWTNEGTDSAAIGEACAAGNPLGIAQVVLDTSPCKVS